MTRSLRFLTATNYGCHTLRRFGPCDKLYIEEYNDYHFKLNRFKMYPLIIGNDDCTARVYTWDYWKFFLHGNLPAYLGSIIFFHAFYMLIN